MKWDTHQPPPTIKDFQYKVTEADAYLQLMIEQIKVSFAIQYFPNQIIHF